MSPVAGTQSGGVMNDIPGEPYRGIKANFQVIYKRVEHHLFAWHHIITSNLKTGREIKVKNQNSLLIWKQNNKEKYFPSQLILVSVGQTYLNTERRCYTKNSPLVLILLPWCVHKPEQTLPTIGQKLWELFPKLCCCPQWEHPESWAAYPTHT